METIQHLIAASITKTNIVCIQTAVLDVRRPYSKLANWKFGHVIMHLYVWYMCILTIIMTV